MAPKKLKGLRSLLAGCWDAMKGERRAFCLFAVLFVLAYSTDLLIPWAIGHTINAFVRHGFTDEAYHQALIGISFYLGLRLACVTLHHFGRYLQFSVAYCAKMRSLERIFTALIRYRLDWHVSQHSGENLAKLNRSTMAVKAMIGQHSWQVLEGMIKLVLAAGAMFALDFWVALNVAVMSGLTVLFMIYFNGQVTRTLRATNAFDNRINRICLDYLSNIVTIKALNLEQVAEQYVGRQRADGISCTKSFSRWTELKWAAINIGYAVVMASSLLLYFLTRRHSVEPLDVAQVYVVISYLDKIFQSISGFTAYFGGIVEACTAYEDADELLKSAPAEHAAAAIPAMPWDALDIRRLSFSYAADEGTTVDARLSFGRGERIALIGASGCGKSTLLKILGGALTPHVGDVSTADGRSMAVDDIAQLSLLIPQEPQIFAETLHYNITMGEHFDPEHLEEIVSLCRLTELKERLPQGWDTNLAESGLNISGGERQRIAIARALLRADRKQILLLDEPTSSLDPKTERELLEGLFAAFPDRTIISSCHRWNLLPLFDKVIHLQNGSTLREGRPEDYGSSLNIAPPAQALPQNDAPVFALAGCGGASPAFHSS